MTLSREELEASYARCRSIARRARSSFYPCFFLLPQEKRRAMEAFAEARKRADTAS